MVRFALFFFFEFRLELAQFSMNQPNSARFGQSLSRVSSSRHKLWKKKKKLDAAPTHEQRRPSRVAVSGHIGRGCNMGFSVFVHPSSTHALLARSSLEQCVLGNIIFFIIIIIIILTCLCTLLLYNPTWIFLVFDNCGLY